MSQTLSEPGSRPARSARATWLRRIGLLVLSLVCARIIINLVGSIDWNAVWGGLEHLEAWQLAVLVAALILRQFLNAMPLVFFIDGLSVLRATGSDQGGTLLSMIAPPTADSVFRVVVMRSWGIDVGKAAAGGTCNILVFYIARWTAPLLGVLLLSAVRFDGAYALTAAGSIVIAAVILAGSVMVTRSQQVAQRVGRVAGRVAARIRRSVDPEKWASAVGDFQSHIADRFLPGSARALPVLVGFLLVDATILLLAIRFVGVSQGSLSWVEVEAAFLVTFPLTLLPFQGIGVLDATLVAILTSIGGAQLEPALVASLMTYRVITLGTPAILGAFFILGWRHTQRRANAGSVPPSDGQR